MRKNELDEMQLQRRNRIGNQAFIMLFYLLMLDIGLYGLGFRWLRYPIDVFLIMLSCMTYYLIRIIWSNACIGPQTAEKHARKKVLFIGAITGCISAAGILISQIFINTKAANGNDYEALILFVFSIVSLIIAFIARIVSKRQNSDGDE